MLTDDRLVALLRGFELSDPPRPGYLDELRESLAMMCLEPSAERVSGGILDVLARRWRLLDVSPRLVRVALIALLIALLAGASVGIALVGSRPQGEVGIPVLGFENGRIAFVRVTSSGEPQGIWVSKADGSDAVAITTAPAVEDEPTWSPDGSLIAFTRVLVPDEPRQNCSPNDKPTCARSMPGTSGLFVARPDGSAERLVAGPLPSPIFDLAWSPDGTRLSLLAGDPWGLLVVNADGSNLRYLYAGVLVDPQWSPDGGSLLLHDHPELSNGDLYLVSLDGTARQLTVTPGAEGGARWSPDGRQIVFSFDVDGSGWQRRIEVMEVTGEGRRVVSTTGLHPEWSPDGEWIVFQEGPERPVVSVVRPDGSGLHQVVDGENPRWSPDGNLIAYWADNDWWTIRPDGTDRQPTHIGSGNSLSGWWDWQAVPR